MAACAWFLAWVSSRSGEKCSQKLVRQKGAVGAGKGAANVSRIVGVAGNDLGPGVLERLGLLRVRLPGDGADSESAVSVGQDRASQSPALRTGGPDDRNDLFLGHDDSPK